MFEKEINGELVLMEQALYKNQEDTIKARFQPAITSINREIDQLKTEIDQKEKQRDELRIAAQQEADGTGGSMRRNLGPIYQVKKQDADRVQQELVELKARNDTTISSRQKEIDLMQAAFNAEIANLQREKFDGLAARIHALGNLTGKSEPIYWANLFIILLFIAIETAPVFVKLIGGKGPYDDLLQTHEHGFDLYRTERTTKASYDTAQRLSYHTGSKTRTAKRTETLEYSD